MIDVLVDTGSTDGVAIGFSDGLGGARRTGHPNRQNGPALVAGSPPRSGHANGVAWGSRRMTRGGVVASAPTSARRSLSPESGPRTHRCMASLFRRRRSRARAVRSWRDYPGRADLLPQLFQDPDRAERPRASNLDVACDGPQATGGAHLPIDHAKNAVGQSAQPRRLVGVGAPEVVDDLGDGAAAFGVPGVLGKLVVERCAVR